jgi:hypothetical protein
MNRECDGMWEEGAVVSCKALSRQPLAGLRIALETATRAQDVGVLVMPAIKIIIFRHLTP